MTVENLNRAPRLVALEGAAGPAELGGVYSTIHAATISEDGDVAFSATLAGGSAGGAVVLQTGEGARSILRSGQEAPAGGRYAAFDELDMTTRVAAGEAEKVLLFRAALDGGPASEGVFAWTPSDVKPVARAGGRSPRGRVYRSFGQLTVESFGDSLVSLAFVATMDDGTKSIVMQTLGEAPVEILSTGDRLGDETVEGFSISRLGLSLSCVADLRHTGTGARGAEAIVVHDGFVLSGGTLRTGADVPTVGRVRRLLGTPGLNSQDGFVAVEFDGGACGLARRDVLGDSVFFTRTGDAAPGLRAQTISRFGPPVANSLPLDTAGLNGSFAVASQVTLADRRAGVWLGTFDSKSPMRGTAKLLLLDDYASGAPSPLKLTNRGALLLRAPVQVGGTPRVGLLVADSLFDHLAA